MVAADSMAVSPVTKARYLANRAKYWMQSVASNLKRGRGWSIMGSRLQTDWTFVWERGSANNARGDIGASFVRSPSFRSEQAGLLSRQETARLPLLTSQDAAPGTSRTVLRSHNGPYSSIVHIAGRRLIPCQPENLAPQLAWLCAVSSNIPVDFYARRTPHVVNPYTVNVTRGDGCIGTHAVLNEEVGRMGVSAVCRALYVHGVV